MGFDRCSLTIIIDDFLIDNHYLDAVGEYLHSHL